MGPANSDNESTASLSTLPGDDVRQRRLPRARRAVEEGARKPVRVQHPSQQLALAQQVLLPDKLIESPRAHPHRQWLNTLAPALALLVKQAHA